MLIGPALSPCVRLPPGLSIPAFALDLSTGALPAAVVTTRAGATGTYIDASGVRQTAAADTARLHYPRAGRRRVLLREPARENKALRSRDISHSAWFKENASVVGTNVLVASAATQTQGIVQGITLAGSTIHCLSAELEQRDWRYAQLMVYRGGGVFDAGDFVFATFDLLAGTVVATSTSAVCGIERGADGRWLAWMLFTYAASPTNPYVGIYAGNGAGDAVAPSIVGTGQTLFEVDELQVEEGSNPTSRIRTTSAAVTRPEDVVRVTGAAFSAFWNASAGSLVFRGSFPYAPPASAFPALLSANDNTANERINLYLSQAAAGLGMVIVDGGVTGATQLVSGVATYDDVPFRIAGAFELNSAQAAAAGGQVTAGDTSVTLPTVTQLEIGRQQGALSGALPIHIDSIAYWAERLPAGRLAQATEE